MKSDDEIKRDVEDELRWDPDLESADIAVSVKSGVVTLTGFARSYIEKYNAENDVKRVAGVIGVANDIEVRLPSVDERPDPEIARDATEAIKNILPLSYKNMKVLVDKGWITLEGQAEWNFQRESAENAVRKLQGVKGVINMIEIRPSVTPSDIKKKIEQAFKRSAEIDSKAIKVETRGDEVVLEGTVHSWFEREEAERAAWSAPGVKKVEDRISIRP